METCVAWKMYTEWLMRKAKEKKLLVAKLWVKRTLLHILNFSLAHTEKKEESRKSFYRTRGKIDFHMDTHHFHYKVRGETLRFDLF